MAKKFINGFILLLMIFYLCSCSDTNKKQVDSVSKAESTTENVTVTDAEDEDGIVNLTVWAEGISMDITNQMIENFIKKYENEAEFNITVLENADSETKDNLLADIHNAPDVFSMPDDQLAALVAAGVLDPVPDSETIKSINTPESVAASSINNILYAYPMTADNGFFLYYDKKYFSEDDVKELDRILEICAENEKQFTMEFVSGWYSYAFFGNTGLEFGLNPDGVTNYCTWNSTEGDITGVEIAQALLDITSNPAFKNRSDGEFSQVIHDGTAIAGISGVWNAIEVQDAWGNDYGACKLPTYTVDGKQIQMSSFTGFKMLGVNHYSEHADWANKLAAWLTNEENQTTRFVERNQGPSNINAAASDEVMKVPAIRAVIEQSEFGSLQRVGNKYWDATTSFANSILAGNPDMNLQELMDKLVADITASVAD